MNKTQTFSGLEAIGQIAVNTGNLDQAVDYYQNTLGMNFMFRVPKMAFFDCGGVRLMLAVPEKPEFDHPSSLIYFRVEDIADAYRIMSDRGVEFFSEPQCVARQADHELWMAFFSDLDGNTLALMSEVPLD
jgi:methylmalonyl-CoA/ethylmalonyl-CoA epimerase